jgi:RimJ/RimL family protein N-acetyltransferase
MERDGYLGEGWRGAVILLGQRELVAKWIATKSRDCYAPPDKDYEAIGVVRGADLIGGICYTEYREIAPGQHDIRLTAAGEPGWLTRRTIKVLLGYPFQQLSCVRITSIIAKPNKTARSLNERLGFKIEGCVRDGRGIGKDCILYGLLKADAERWLK